MLVLVSGSTKTMKRLAASKQRNLGVLLTPSNGNSVESVLALGLPWACDNGAFKGFDAGKFRVFLAKIKNAPGCLWVACPDVVGDAKITINRFAEWSSEVKASGHPVAFVLQDGQEDLEIPEADAYFIGGSTEFKLSEAAHELVLRVRPKWVHMGRVNSKKRMTLAYQSSVDSVDGSGMSMFGDAHIQKFCEHSAKVQREGFLFRV